MSLSSVVVLELPRNHLPHLHDSSFCMISLLLLPGWPENGFAAVTLASRGMPAQRTSRSAKNSTRPGLSNGPSKPGLRLFPWAKARTERKIPRFYILSIAKPRSRIVDNCRPLPAGGASAAGHRSAIPLDGAATQARGSWLPAGGRRWPPCLLPAIATGTAWWTLATWASSVPTTAADLA